MVSLLSLVIMHHRVLINLSVLNSFSLCSLLQMERQDDVGRTEKLEIGGLKNAKQKHHFTVSETLKNQIKKEGGEKEKNEGEKTYLA